jgi:D-inositol-3-phosphate glycosyltransferase
MKPLRIAMISVHSSPLGKLGTQDTGGMSVYIRELSRELGRLGHRVDIFTRAGDRDMPGAALPISENVRLIALALTSEADAPKAALFPHLSRFFDSLETFRVKNAQVYDLIHSHYWLSGQVGLWAQHAWGTPHVTTFHTLGEVKDRISGRPARRSLGAGRSPESDVRLTVERELAEACDLVLMTSAKEKANLLRYYPAREEAIAVVPCGVNFDLFRPLDSALARRRIGAAEDEILALFVGRFAPEKGLPGLIAAAALLKRHERLRVIVVGGDGSGDAAHERMMALSLRYGLAERVTFVGRVDHEELPFYYNAADVLVVPSLYESFGMVALEALACGTPVVAARVGAMEELLRSRLNGRLTKDQRPASLAADLLNFFSHRDRPPSAPDLIRRSVASFSWPRVTSGVLDAYATTIHACRLGPNPRLAGFRLPAARKAASWTAGEPPKLQQFDMESAVSGFHTGG